MTEEFHNGANWMLDSIRGSLCGYPHSGGDVEVMKEVDRIKKEAVIAEHKRLCWMCKCCEGCSQKCYRVKQIIGEES